MAGKTTKKLTLKEIRAIEPKAELYELNQYCKYIVMIPRSTIALHQNVEIEAKAREVMRVFAALKIPCAILVGTEDVKFIELVGVKE